MYIPEHVFHIPSSETHDHVVSILIVSLSETGYGLPMKCSFMILTKLTAIIRYESSDENDW